jgi:hypothetical protein
MRNYKKTKKQQPGLIKLPALFVLLAALGGGLASCGIETYKYLDPVYADGISMLLNTTAYIRLPPQPDYYFRYFTIYYRIYISDLSVDVVDTGILARINPTLLADYNYFYSYTNTTSTVVPTTMGTIFSSRKYFPLELESPHSLEGELSITGGGLITLDFAANTLYKPSLVMGDLRVTPGATRLQLSRNTRNENNPYANNYYFVNSTDVNNGDLISPSSDSSRINQDVQNSAQSISGPKYTYVSMYILSYGLDDNFTNIYSIPTFIGIFRLPD